MIAAFPGRVATGHKKKSEKTFCLLRSREKPGRKILIYVKSESFHMEWAQQSSQHGLWNNNIKSEYLFFIMKLHFSISTFH